MKSKNDLFHSFTSPKNQTPQIPPLPSCLPCSATPTTSRSARLPWAPSFAPSSAWTTPSPLKTGPLETSTHPNQIKITFPDPPKSEVRTFLLCPVLHAVPKKCLRRIQIDESTPCQNMSNSNILFWVQVTAPPTLATTGTSTTGCTPSTPTWTAWPPPTGTRSP